MASSSMTTTTATLQAVRALLKTANFDEVAIERSLKALHRAPDAHDDGPLLLNQKQAAQLLGVSRYTIRRLALDGALTQVWLRGSPWYRRDAILELSNGGLR